MVKKTHKLPQTRHITLLSCDLENGLADRNISSLSKLDFIYFIY